MQERLSYGIQEAAQAIGVSRSTMYVLISEGELRPFKVGSRTLILRRDLEAFIERRAGVAP